MNKLKIYNTLSRKIEEFKPISDEQVTIYSCGPTVYSDPHIGNMRAYTFTDTLVRVLRFMDYNVLNVINITDVGHLTSDADSGEDKLEKEANKLNVKSHEIAEKYTQAFFKDIKNLNIIEPNFYPKATDYIDEQIKLIQTLESKGYTYKIDDGIYYDTSQFKAYNHLSKSDLDGLDSGHRVEFTDKKNKSDFALWKFSPKDSTRDMEWDSPWGIGFPGWHIECSAMAMALLGEHIDIHTGGIDHISIHHSNEIAQSEACTNKKFSNYWMHVNFLQIQKDDNLSDDELKMSKSKGNVKTVSGLINIGFEAMAIKYLYLTGHYRNELEYSESLLKSASNALNRIKRKIIGIKNGNNDFVYSDSDLNQKIINSLLDDLNTPIALSFFHESLNSNNLNRDEKLTIINDFDKLLGLNLIDISIEDEIPMNILELASKRWDAKINKDFKLSDEIRNELKSLGYSVEDNGNINYKVSKI